MSTDALPWAKIIYSLRGRDYETVWVTWEDAAPYVMLNITIEPDGKMDLSRKIEGTIMPLFNKLNEIGAMPAWFADCDRVTFSPMGVMFLGPVEVFA